jgi:hypothetical protein
VTFDCMTTEELSLWQMSGGRSPCRDCPAWFRETERAAGRCHQRSVARLAQMHRYNLARAREKWDNTPAGRSGESNSIAHDARPSATTREAGVAASIEVVAR